MPSSTVIPSTESAETLLIQYNNELRHGLLPLTVVFGIEIVVGLVGNLLTLYVFLFRYKSCNFRYFVLSLACIDLISCLTTIPGEIVSQIFWYDYPVPPVCMIKDFFNQFTVCSDAGCLTLIAVDRYRKVCKPFGWQIKHKVAIIACVVIYMTAAVLAIPTQILWGIRSGTLVYKDTNITFTICEKAQRYATSTLPFAYVAINGSLVLFTLVCMFVLYFQITKKLINFKSSKQQTFDMKEVVSVTQMDTSQRDTTSDMPLKEYNFARYPNPSSINRKTSSKKENKPSATITARVRRKTMIMFYLTLIFIITIVIYYALLSGLATGVLSTLSDSEKVAYFFFLRLYFINHAINPILFGFLDPHVRHELYKMKSYFRQKWCDMFCNYRS